MRVSRHGIVNLVEEIAGNDESQPSCCIALAGRAPRAKSHEAAN
jgi:hypothetical protein